MIKALLDHYRCPETFCSCFRFLGELLEQPRFFHFGQNHIYGRFSGRSFSKENGHDAADARVDAEVQNSKCLVPFDPDEAVENLRRERYPTRSLLGAGSKLSRKAYYNVLRPMLPFGVRNCLKRISLRGWKQKSFPSWPVDRTVDKTLEHLLLRAMDTLGVGEVPFIWFWPKGYLG